MEHIGSKGLGKRLLSIFLALSIVFSLSFLSINAKAVDVETLKENLSTKEFLEDIFSGEGTESNPYQIATEDDLISLQLISNGDANFALSDVLNNGSGKYFKLTADISLTADWTPIANGSDYYFAGSFDGDGHTISGLNMTAETAAGETVYGGLFGYTDGATISNLTVTGRVSVSMTADEENTDSSAIYAGGIIGFALDTTVSDCAVNVTVMAANAATGTVNVVVGGAVGYLGVSSAEASASVTSVSAQSGTYVSAETSADGDAILTLAGGVVGLAHGSDVSGCTSAASVVVNGSETLYQTGAYTTYGQFYNSLEDGTSTNEGTGYYNLNEYHYSNTAGGVVGAAVSVYTLGTSSSGTGAGATTGIIYEIDKTTTVMDCSSDAVVVNKTGSTLSFAGGVVGTSQFATVSECSLSSGGQVSGAYAGGIFGVIAGDNTISDCTASGIVTGTVSAGGIAGQLGGHEFSRSGNQSSSSATFADSTLTDCTVTGGTVQCSDGYAGGIVGYMTYADSISGSSNVAAVSGSNAGGILGGVLNSYSSSGGAYANGSINYNVSLSNNVVTDCNNTGTVSGSVSAGGVAGYVANPCTTISDCSNSGSVTSTASGTDDSYAGGVIAYYYSVPDYSESLVRNVGNSANVMGSATYAGGVIGYLNGQTSNISDTSVVLLNSYNGGTVTGGEYVGGIAGRAVYGFGNCYNSGTVSGTSYVGALAGGASSISTYSDSYALNNSASFLIGMTGGSSSKGSQENLVFFDESQAVSTSVDGYSVTSLLQALNTYVVRETSVELSNWELDSTSSNSYPVFTDDFSSYEASATNPVVVVFLNGAATADTELEVAVGDTISFTAVASGSGDVLQYQWYSSTSADESSRTAISGATSSSYSPSTSTAGVTYYWISVASRNSYTWSSEVFSSMYTVTTEFVTNEDGSLDGGTFTIYLKDSNSAENSADNPYLIDTAAKLHAVSALVNTSSTPYYFEQTASIDLEDATWNGIGSSDYPFCGAYDGGGYSVTGLNVSGSSTGYYGMFGYVTGTVENLTVSGTVTVDCTDSKTYVGGIVGELYGSSASLENCLVTDMAVSGGYYTGGLVGYTEKSPQIWNCAANAEVVGGYSAGGLIGLLYSGYVYNSYAIGTVSGVQYAGGLIGWAASNSNYIYNSYSATTLSADETGGLIGLAVGTTISNSYYLEQDNLDVCGSTSGLSLNYSGSFDTSETVTAVSNCSLAYDGDLTSQLNGWVLDNYQTYTELIGWQAQEDAYPTFSSVYLAAAGTVEMEGFEIDLNETKTLTATVTLDEGDIGTLTCQWYRDGVALSENTTVVDSSTLNDRSFFVSNDVTGSEPGLFIYTVVVENDNGYSNKSISADATVTVNKVSGDTTWYGVVGTNFDGGTGTETDPYLISDTDTLAYLAQQVNAGGEDVLGKSYLLTTDLNLNNVLWTPIGNSENTFSGTFDGGGHTISGLLVDSTDDYQGLFGYASGTTTIQNLVVSGEVNCAGKSAGLIGFVLKGSTVTISNCGNEATVNATSTYVAGLIGNLGSAKDDVTTCIIKNCYNSGTINGGNGTGGFIGYVAAYANVTISNCYNIGSIVSTGNYAGGIAGYGVSSASLNVSNCYNAGTVSAIKTADAISGRVWTAENCYYLSGRCSTAYTSGVEAFSQSDVATLNEKLGDDFVSSTAGTVSFVTEKDVSVVVEGETVNSITMAGYPLLSWQSGDTGIGSVVFTLNMPDGTIATEVTASNGGSIEQSGDEYTLVFSGDETVTVETLAVTTVTFETVTETSQSTSQTFAEDSATVYASGTSGLYYVAPGDTIKFSVSVADTCALTSVSAVTTSEDGTENEVILSPDSEGLYSVTVTENTTIRCVVIARVKLSVTGDVTFTNESLNKLTKVGAIYYIVPGDSIDFTIQVSSNQLLRSVTTNDYGTIVEPDEEGVYTLSVADDATAALIYISYSKVAVTLADTEASYTYSGEAYEPAVVVTVAGEEVTNGETYSWDVTYSDNTNAGSATVLVTFTNYEGSGTATFTINPKEITSDDFTVDTADAGYTGSEVVKTISSELIEGTDYTVSYADNTALGTATITITGAGNYTGTLTYEFQIVTAELDSETVTISFDEAIYTGEDVKPAVKVVIGESELTEDTDYTVVYGDETTDFVNAGSDVTVTVTFQGNYSGTATATYTIAKADQTLTVNHDTQELPVSASKDLSTLNLVSGNQTELVYGLAEGDGFTLNGSVLTTPETAGATATITIYAVEGDNYNASEPVAVTVTTVNKAEVSESITFESGTATYTGEALTYEAASVKVEETDGTWTYVYYDADGTKLDSAPTDAGTYTVTATYTSGDSTGTASTNFTIEPQPVEATVALSDSSAVYTYTGNAIEPDVEITVDGAALTEDTVYTYEISYADEVNAGTASATVTFTGNYSGEASTTFTIEARTLTADDFALESDSVVYDGTEQKPVVILADGLNLTEGTDYSIEYANNTDVGTATVTITGLEPNCTGSAELTFEITGSDVSESVTVTVADGSYVYTGEAIEPEVTVTRDESVLTEGEDYTVTYSNNINASTEESTATVTVTLTGNYSGTVLTESFTIEKAEQTLVMRNDGTIIAEIGETLDLATLIEDTSSYAGTSVLMFTAPTGFTVTNGTTLGVTQTVEAGAELELTVYALGTTNYNVSETVTFTVTAVARTSITIDSDNADIVVYERTTETDEDGEVQTVDTLLSADAETGAYSAKQGMTISFTVTPESGYGLPNVTVNGETVEPDENGYYVVELTAELLAEDSDLVISVSVKRTSWDESSGDTADADIESIIASVAAGTQTEDADGSTYEDSLDYNDDGKNDLLDILNILYRTEEQDTDSTDETVEEAASEDATEDATETSDGASEDASDEDSDESSDEAAAGSDSEAADDSGADTGADSEAASGDAAE